MDADLNEQALAAGRDYEKLFVPALFAGWPKHLLEVAAIQAGDRVLDVACGTGVLARRALLATGPTGEVVGVDAAPGMLAAAKEIEAGIDWILGGAEVLTLNDGYFDHVFSQFGMMFFTDRLQAAAEMYRVLKPGGRVVIAVWRSIEHNPAYATVVDILQSEVGSAAADALRLPYCLGDADLVRADLEGAGFVDLSCEAVSDTASFTNPRTMVEAELRGWLPLFDILLNEQEIEQVLSVASDELAGFVNGTGAVTFPTSAYVFSAGKV